MKQIRIAIILRFSSRNSSLVPNGAMIKHNGPDRDSGSKVKNRNCRISTLSGPEMAEITDFTFVTDRFIIPVFVKQSGLFR